mmetsp:Transcript_851/g.2418  ORF Transcript_851/g.2418 Transcript_851/m.2418 type:complete len:227 (-) Transcript_851:514-1194(-)
MINILRTKQVRAAQRGIPTGLVYKQNEKTLSKIGVDQLETMLRLRDWQPIADVKVNRREIEALRVAQDYQQTGEVQSSDQDLIHDATPAAAKVDREQVEQGNLVNVVLQALEKRLGTTTGGKPQQLSGPETSATMMASDLLLKELISRSGDAASSSSSPADARMAAAQKAIMDDFASSDDGSAGDDRGDEATDVLFGRSGLMDGNESGGGGDEDPYAAGANPASFY